MQSNGSKAEENFRFDLTEMAEDGESSICWVVLSNRDIHITTANRLRFEWVKICTSLGESSWNEELSKISFGSSNVQFFRSSVRLNVISFSHD